MRQIQAEIERGMADGAVGLSTGMDYIAQCFAGTDELVEACQVMAPYQGLYVTHILYKKGILTALKEAVEIGRRAGVPVHISHLKAADPHVGEVILNYVDRVATQEVDFSFDVYPYMPGSTMLTIVLPYEVWEDGPLAVLPKLNDPRVRAKIATDLPDSGIERMVISWVAGKDNSHHQGKRLTDYIAETGLSAVDAICNLLIEENLTVLMVAHHADDSLIEPFLTHSHHMMGTDGIYQHEGVIHPRLYGSTGRMLGRNVREHNYFSLEDAVYKLSGYPAYRFGLVDRGSIQADHYADTVADQAGYDEPHQYCSGVETVLVNGVPIIRAGEAVTDLPEPLPGRALKFKQSM